MELADWNGSVKQIYRKGSGLVNWKFRAKAGVSFKNSSRIRERVTHTESTGICLLQTDPRIHSFSKVLAV